jgi:uncharacterized membrane protein YeiH
MNPIAQGELVASALLVFEVIGVLAFAASGLIEAARKKFDIFGVVLIAFIAAFGGGTLRDILLDRRPFFWVENQELLWLVIAFAVLAPLFFRARHIEFTSRAMEWPDAVGLGLFATSGAQLALDAGASPFIAALMAVVTTVFGGILRDVLVNEIPRAVNDHQPYAVLAFAGAWLMWGLQQLNVDEMVSITITAVAIILFRFAAIIFKWKLPAWRL